jgi:hypothetical protein
MTQLDDIQEAVNEIYNMVFQLICDSHKLIDSGNEKQRMDKIKAYKDKEKS